MSKLNTKNNQFPVPHSHSELVALQPAKEKFQNAKTKKRLATGALLISGLTIGADTLADNDTNSISLIAAPIAGVSASSAARERSRQQKALSEANHISEAYNPSEIPTDR